MESCNVARALREHAKARPDTAALLFPARHYRTEAPAWDTLTFAELDRASDAFGRGFLRTGVKRGDRTLLLMKPGLDFYAVLFALLKIGAVPVLLDPGMGMRALLKCIARTRPRAMVAASLVHAIAIFLRGPFSHTHLRITAGWRWFWRGPTLASCRDEASDPLQIADTQATDDAAILFTSGSTGLAKGVSSTHGMFCAQVDALREMFDFQPGQKDAQAFAAFAVFDICLGMTSILHRMDLSRPASARPEDICATFRTQQPDVAFASPIVWQNLSRYALAEKVTFDSLRIGLTVGAPIPAYLLRRYKKILSPGRQMYTPYGATEGLPVSWIGTDEILGETWAQTAMGAGTCVGRLAPFVDVRILQITEDPIVEWDPSLLLPAGEVGEVTICGPQVSTEYKDVPEANLAAKIPDGDRLWHRMGDLGYLDEHGRLWFCGRKAHRLETADGMLPAVPVEGVFNEHPDVFRTALVGVGPRGAELPVLVVELEPGRQWSDALESALVALASHTPHSGRVQRFLHHPAFPTDARHNSKIRRGDLRPWAAARCTDLVEEAP